MLSWFSFFGLLEKSNRFRFSAAAQVAGERFCVRNSGATVVVEGVGEHGCEYMTGGRVLILGYAGRNFAAGMSGGVAYVIDPDEILETRCNPEMVDLETPDADDLVSLRFLIEKHVAVTGSKRGTRLLANWEDTQRHIVKVMPREYKRVLMVEAKAKAEQREPDFAELVGTTVIRQAGNSGADDVVVRNNG